MRQFIVTRNPANRAIQINLLLETVARWVSSTSCLRVRDTGPHTLLIYKYSSIKQILPEWADQPLSSTDLTSFHFRVGSLGDLDKLPHQIAASGDCVPWLMALVFATDPGKWCGNLLQGFGLIAGWIRGVRDSRGSTLNYTLDVRVYGYKLLGIFMAYRL